MAPFLHQRDPGFVVGEKLTPDERAERIRRATERSDKLFAKASAVIRILEEGASGGDLRAELRQIALEIRPLVRAIETVWCDEEPFVRRARELAKAEKMGLVTILNIHETPSLYYNPLDLKANVGRELARADSYGALDERFVAEFRQLSKGQAAKVGAARVGATVLQGLPGFSEATLEEIRDIRHDLGRYLARFRKAVLTISRQIESEPWSSDFPHEVERELRLHVEPAVA